LKSDDDLGDKTKDEKKDKNKVAEIEIDMSRKLSKSNRS